MTTTISSADAKRELLDLLPDQGCWSDNWYLWLTETTRRMVELTDGYIEILPMPTYKHQAASRFLFLALTAFLTPLGGEVLYAALRVRIRAGKYREPDVLAVKSVKDPRRGNRYWSGADLVMEVVSPDDPKRDLIDKPRDYAEAKIPEYWIVNPLDETITVLRLDGGTYAEHGVFRRGQQATSVILPGFAVNIDDVFNVDSPPDEPEGEESEPSRGQ
jgi:Uma2 family endonuclease